MMIRNAKMMIDVAIVFFLLSLASRAFAGVPCQQDTLLAGQNIGTYLTQYYFDCLKAEDIREELKRNLNIEFISAVQEQNISDEEAISNYKKLVSAWTSVSKSFKSISDDNTTPELKLIFDSFSSRAAATSLSLNAVLGGAPAKDNALFRANTWKFTKMVLPEYSEAGETPYPPIDTEYSFNKECSERTSSNCKNALRQGKALLHNWAKASILASVISNEVNYKVFLSIQRKEKLWNTYLYSSKPMWPLDFILTDKLNPVVQSGFATPPKTQYFFFHPSVSFEYAQSAADGQQLKPVLYLEILGFNRWNMEDRPFKNIPLLNAFSGASLIASYADRAGIKDNGYGALLTFNNVYSIGVSRYGKDTALSVSMDLANLFRERFKDDYWRHKVAAEGNTHAD